jgi:hypothetical protein
MNSDYRITLLANCISDDATLSGGNWRAALPLTNMQVPKKYFRGARSVSADPDDTTFDVVLGGVENIRGIVVGPGNFTTAASLDLEIHGDAGFSGAIATYSLSSLHPIAPWGTLPFGAKYWFNGVTPWSNPERRACFIMVLDQNIGAMYLRFKINDPLNPDGYVQIGRLFISTAWIPEINYEPDNNAFGINDMTLRSNTLSGGIIDWRRINPRFFQFSIKYLDIAAVFGDFFGMVDRVGFDGEVFVIQNPSDSDFLQQRSFFARITDQSPIAQANVDRGNIGLKLTEII